MYAVVESGGKQLKVTAGDIVRVDRLSAAPGDTVELGPVHLLAQDEGIVADPAALGNVKVVCEVVREDRGKKIRVFKKKRRKNYARTYGHRQWFTELKVVEIKA